MSFMGEDSGFLFNQMWLQTMQKWSLSVANCFKFSKGIRETMLLFNWDLQLLHKASYSEQGCDSLWIWG